VTYDTRLLRVLAEHTLGTAMWAALTSKELPSAYTLDMLSPQRRFHEGSPPGACIALLCADSRGEANFADGPMTNMAVAMTQVVTPETRALFNVFAGWIVHYGVSKKVVAPYRQTDARGGILFFEAGHVVDAVRQLALTLAVAYRIHGKKGVLDAMRDLPPGKLLGGHLVSASDIHEMHRRAANRHPVVDGLLRQINQSPLFGMT
jgi:hypothetical protein